jgi:1-acyl-sn-glycerol-3-phosphate acyltransferase
MSEEPFGTAAQTAPGLRRMTGLVRASTRLLALSALAGGGRVWCRWLARDSEDPHRAILAGLQGVSRILVERLGLELDPLGEPPAQPALIVANHRSYVDIPLLLARVPAVFLAKVEIGDWPLFGPLAHLARTVFVRREDPASRKAALERLGAIMDAALPVVVFPEGTTSRGPGVGPFRTGSFRLAAERGVSVVPVAIAYHDPLDAWIDDDDFVAHFLDRFAAPRMRVSVRFGPPFRGVDAIELAERARSWIAEQLEELDGRFASRAIAPPVLSRRSPSSPEILARPRTA